MFHTAVNIIVFFIFSNLINIFFFRFTTYNWLEKNNLLRLLKYCVIMLWFHIAKNNFFNKTDETTKKRSLYLEILTINNWKTRKRNMISRINIRNYLLSKFNLYSIIDSFWFISSVVLLRRHFDKKYFITKSTLFLAQFHI